jgi:hypothetical protein
MAGANGQPAVGNVGSGEERVSTAALLAAMELIRGMSENPAASPADQLLDDIQQAAIGPEELTQAFAPLLYGFLHVFNDADVDMIVGSVTRRLRRLQLVPEVMVTRMHGAMGAAAAGQSPLGWREQFGPMPPAEALAWAYTTWLLADLLDYVGDERGQRDRFSDRVVEMLLTVDPEPGGGSDAARDATNEPSRRMRMWMLQERGVTADQVDWPQMSHSSIASFAWHGGESQRSGHQAISYRRLRPLP